MSFTALKVLIAVDIAAWAAIVSACVLIPALNAYKMQRENEAFKFERAKNIRYLTALRQLDDKEIEWLTDNTTGLRD